MALSNDLNTKSSNSKSSSRHSLVSADDKIPFLNTDNRNGNSQFQQNRNDETKPKRQCSRILLALLYRLILIKIRRPLIFTIEFLVPIILASCLLIPRFLYTRVELPMSTWTGDNTREGAHSSGSLFPTAFLTGDSINNIWDNVTETFNSPTDYMRCPFGLYGHMGLGLFSHQLFNRWTAHSGPEFRDALANAAGSLSKDISRLACNSALISKSPYMRPLFHFSRTFDGKFFNLLPYIAYRDGPIMFASYRDDDSVPPDTSPSSCSALKQFFDVLYFNLNPYLWSSQKGFYLDKNIPPNAPRQAFQTELQDLSELLYEIKISDNPEKKSQAPFVLYAKKYIETVKHWHRNHKYPPTVDFLTHHIEVPIPKGVSKSEPVNNHLDLALLETYPIHTLIACDERQNLGGPKDIGRLDFNIRMNSASGTVPDVRTSVAETDTLLLYYDAESTWKYFNGDMHPRRSLNGGFLNFQSILYAHLFNITSVRNVHISSPNSAIPLPIHLSLHSETTTLDHRQQRRHLEDAPNENRTEVVDDLSNCLDICIDYRLDGSQFCNPACQLIHGSKDHESSKQPAINFKDSKAITFLLQHCTWLPGASVDFNPCTIATIQAACTACTKIDQKELLKYVKVLEFSHRKNKGAFWKILTSALVTLDIEPADTVFCLGMFNWLFAAEGNDSSKANKVYNNDTPLDSDIAQGFLNLIFTDHCLAYPALNFYTMTALTAWSKNPNFNMTIEPSAGFALMSYMLSNIWVSLKSKKVVEDVLPLRFTETAMPVPSLLYDEYVLTWLKIGAWGLVWAIVYLVVLFLVIRTLMIDQESRVRETFRIMGVAKWLLHSSMYIFYAVYLALLSLCVSGAAFLQYSHSSFLCIFMLNYLNCLCILSLGFLVSSICGAMSSMTAALIAVCCYVLSVIPQYTVSLEFVLSRGPLVNLLMMILFPSMFAYGNVILLTHELPNTQWGGPNPYLGIHMSNLNETYQGLSFGKVLLMLVVDGLIYLLVGLYADEVSKASYGRAKPFYFPFLPSYWFGSCIKRNQKRKLLLLSQQENNKASTISHSLFKNKNLVSSYAKKTATASDSPAIRFKSAGRQFSKFLPIKKQPSEKQKMLTRRFCDWATLADGSVVEDLSPLPSNYKQTVIEAENVEKVFHDRRRFLRSICGKKRGVTAVNGVSLYVRRGEIFVLLGHNGAGKTTTIGLLTGMLSLTSGSVKIMGHDIATEEEECREHIGFCPQHDVLFADLTVEEHLKLFAVIKGVPKQKIKTECISMMSKFRLLEKAHNKAGTLSGGQKRCLSIAIALIGGSSAVFLDEPSTGVDPYTRRFMWEAIKEIRKNTTIILTTHCMEEADYLADRIAIMANARICCHGTPHFLKATYGVGYTFILVKSDKFGLAHQRLLEKLLPGAEVVSNAALEIAFRISHRHSHVLPEALRLLEASPSDYAIERFAVKLTTLEEVFLNVSAQETSLLKPNNLETQGSSYHHLHSISQQNEAEKHVSVITTMDMIPIKKNSLLRRETKNFDSFSTSKQMDESLWLNQMQIDRDRSFSLTYPKIIKSTRFASGVEEIENSDLHISDSINDADTVNTSSTKTSYGSCNKTNDDAIRAAAKLREENCCGCRRNLIVLDALLKKRFWLAKRNFSGFACQLLVPIIFLVVCIAATQQIFKSSSVRLFLNATPYTTYSYRDLSESPVLISASQDKSLHTAKKDSSSSILSSTEAANILKTCPVLKYTADHKGFKSKYIANQSNVHEFERNILNSWDGRHLNKHISSNASLSKIFQSQSPKIFAYYFDDSQSSDSTVKEFMSELANKTIDDNFLELLGLLQETPPLVEGWVFHNGTYRDSLPIGLNTLASCIFMSQNKDAPEITVSNHPLPNSAPLDQAALFVSMAVATIGSAWAYEIVRERVCGAKQAQHLAGVGILEYWLSTYLWDFVCYVPIALLIFGVLKAFNLYALVGEKSQWAFLTLIFLYGVAAAPFSYVFGYCFDSPVGVQAFLTVLGLFAPIFAMTLKSLPNTAVAYDNTLRFFFMIIPNVSLLTGLSGIISANKEHPLWSLKYVGWATIYLGALTIIFILILLIVDVSRVNRHFAKRLLRFINRLRSCYTSQRKKVETQFTLTPLSKIDTVLAGNYLAQPSTLLGYKQQQSLSQIKTFWYRKPQRKRTSSLPARVSMDLTPPRSSQDDIIDTESSFVNVLPEIGISFVSEKGKNLSRRNSEEHWNKQDFLEIHPCKSSDIVPPRPIEHKLALQDLIRHGIEDEDVALERSKIENIARIRKAEAKLKLCGDQHPKITLDIESMQHKPDDFLLTAQGLRKIFPNPKKKGPPKVAVNNLWFGVPRGQCFGLLGVNGAGKTTTMEMITGKIMPVSGTAAVSGFDVLKQTKAANRRIGYCPQFDHCFNDLTGREHLNLYLRLGLLPSQYLKNCVDAIINMIGITECADRPVKTYSGGNRRKLALGLAYLKDPDVVFLDEPSAGVDPKSRRQLWNIIIRATHLAGRSAVLTSHSMEECEALCDRIAIMHAGSLVCIGTPTHLTTRFGEGYQFDITVDVDFIMQQKQKKKIKSDNNYEDFFLECSEETLQYFETNVMPYHFPGSELVETVGLHQRWHVPKERTSLALMFAVAETLKKQGKLKDYGVSETTLEQLFVNVSNYSTAAATKNLENKKTEKF